MLDLTRVPDLTSREAGKMMSDGFQVRAPSQQLSGREQASSRKPKKCMHAWIADSPPTAIMQVLGVARTTDAPTGVDGFPVPDASDVVSAAAANW